MMLEIGVLAPQCLDGLSSIIDGPLRPQGAGLGAVLLTLPTDDLVAAPLIREQVPPLH